MGKATQQRKRYQEQAKESEVHWLDSHKNTNITIIKIFTENLLQTYEDLAIASSLSLCLQKPYLTDFVVSVLLLSSASLISTIPLLFLWALMLVGRSTLNVESTITYRGSFELSKKASSHKSVNQVIRNNLYNFCSTVLIVKLALQSEVRQSSKKASLPVSPSFYLSIILQSEMLSTINPPFLIVALVSIFLTAIDMRLLENLASNICKIQMQEPDFKSAFVIAMLASSVRQNCNVIRF